MAWRTSVAAVTVMLSLLGCQGTDQASPVEDTASVEHSTTTSATITAPPQPVLTAEEKLLQWVRSCEVKAIIFGHSGTFVQFRGREGYLRLRLGNQAEERISDAAFAQECEKRILVGIE